MCYSTIYFVLEYVEKRDRIKYTFVNGKGAEHKASLPCFIKRRK